MSHRPSGNHFPAPSPLEGEGRGEGDQYKMQSSIVMATRLCVEFRMNR